MAGLPSSFMLLGEIVEAASPEAALELALNALKHGDFETRWDVAKVMPGFSTLAIAPLLAILDEEETDWELLWFVARILSNIQHPATGEALATLLKTAAHPEVAGMAATALASLREAAIAPLTALLSDSATRILAVQALAQIQHSDVVAPLLSVVHDPDPAVRAAAIDALSHFHIPPVAAALLAALTDSAAQVRQAALTGLGLQAPQQDSPLTENLLPLLRPLLRDENLDVCRQAAIALGRIGTDQAADALLGVLSPHSPTPLQLEAVRALNWVNTPTAIACLQQALYLGLSDVIEQEIVTVLGRVGSSSAKPQATALLLDLLASDHRLAQTTQGKQTIALSLGQLGQPQAVDALIQLLADAHAGVRLHAIAALKQLAPDRAYEQLRKLAADPQTSPALQAGVAMALREWN